MLFTRIKHDDDVIHVYLNIPSNQSVKNLVHEPLICDACVLQPERDDFILKVCLFCHEGSFFFVPRMHSNLVVTRISILEA